MNNKVEVWKIYPEIEWLQGSNLGSVRTLDHYVMRKNERKNFVKGRVLKQQRNRDGYMYVVFRANSKLVHLYVHRIVASCFIENPDNLPQVNHIDCDPTNNCVNNLEWCSPQYNTAYKEKYGTSAKEAAPKSPVIAINLKTLEALQFKSQREVARQLRVGRGRISMVIRGECDNVSGYWFTRADSNAVSLTREKFGDSVANKVAKLIERTL